jgi:hypothetical protein
MRRFSPPLAKYIRARSPCGKAAQRYICCFAHVPIGRNGATVENSPT